MSTRLVFACLMIAIASSATAEGDQDCDNERGRRLFVKCLACHTAKPDAGHLSGPNLWGVAGRPAGSALEYDYSDALAASGIIWDRYTLGAYVADPSGYLPGTRMVMAPIRNPDEQAALGCYIETLSDTAVAN